MEEIIDNVRQTIAQKKVLWSYPIALKLQENHYSLLIRWAIECIQIYSSEIQSDKLFKLNKYIQQAMDLQNDLTPLQCLQISREVWNIPGREEIQTAISQLWGSISAFKGEENHVGIMRTTMAVELVLPDISNHNLLDHYLEVALRIYEEYESQNPPCE